MNLAAKRFVSTAEVARCFRTSAFVRPAGRAAIAPSHSAEEVATTVGIASALMIAVLVVTVGPENSAEQQKVSWRHLQYCWQQSHAWSWLAQ
jgi:hypothetical protein